MGINEAKSAMIGMSKLQDTVIRAKRMEFVFVHDSNVISAHTGVR